MKGSQNSPWRTQLTTPKPLSCESPVNKLAGMQLPLRGRYHFRLRVKASYVFRDRQAK